MDDQTIESFRVEIKEALKTTYQVMGQLPAKNVELLMNSEKGFTGICHGHTHVYQIQIVALKKEGENPPPVPDRKEITGSHTPIGECGSQP